MKSACMSAGRGKGAARASAAALVLFAAALFSFLLFLPQPAAAAEKATYLSMKPGGVPFCFDISFGDQGNGEYTLFVKDPGYPGKPWASIHAASFAASKTNIVIVPVCISAAGRRLGEEAVLEFTVEAPPAKNTTHVYGVCVRRSEDIDVVATTKNPCEASAAHTDVFSAGLLESEISAKPGEVVNYRLSVSSDFMLALILEKVSGPAMDINTTRLYMPGAKTVDIAITAPQAAGEYPFSIRVSAEGCADPSCQKTAEGKLTVQAAQQQADEGFRIQLSPETADAHGANPAVYYLTVRNLEAQQTFTAAIETDGGLSSDFSRRSDTIGKNGVRTYTITVVPKSEDKALHTIKATVEDGKGMKKTATASLSVHEVVSDLEEYPSAGGVTEAYKDDYSSDADLKKWQSQKAKSASGAAEEPSLEPAGESSPWNVSLIATMLIAVAASAAALFFIYKKTRAVKDEGSAYFEPAEGS